MGLLPCQDSAGLSGYEGHTTVQQLPSPGSPRLSSPSSTRPERLRTPSRDHSPVKPPTGPSNGSTIDIGQGLHVPSETGRRMQAREKDSMFVKDLLVSLEDPAQLQGRSIQGKHCPRFPERPREEPLTPWKVSVIKGCYKHRLEKQGYPQNVIETLLKRMNDYVGEKMADIDQIAKRMKRERPCSGAP
ncbi:hypothetical protein HPB50_029451 [Hyalomma asiaticum]|nr:hypothetical protein HPB50_029451 [Hyalomma asiaticum]